MMNLKLHGKGFFYPHTPFYSLYSYVVFAILILI
jgi:hypothetical protein